MFAGYSWGSGLAQQPGRERRLWAGARRHSRLGPGWPRRAVRPRRRRAGNPAGPRRSWLPARRDHDRDDDPGNAGESADLRWRRRPPPPFRSRAHQPSFPGCAAPPGKAASCLPVTASRPACPAWPLATLEFAPVSGRRGPASARAGGAHRGGRSGDHLRVGERRHGSGVDDQVGQPWVARIGSGQLPQVGGVGLIGAPQLVAGLVWADAMGGGRPGRLAPRRPRVRVPLMRGPGPSWSVLRQR